VANVSFFARDLAPGLDLSATAYNLFNGNYYDSGGPEHVHSTVTVFSEVAVDRGGRG
jgi:hypothetical protein